jgi:hypothetical protein
LIGQNLKEIGFENLGEVPYWQGLTNNQKNSYDVETFFECDLSYKINKAAIDEKPHHHIGNLKRSKSRSFYSRGGALLK